MKRRLNSNRISFITIQILAIVIAFFVLMLPSNSQLKYDQLELSPALQDSIKKIVKAGRLTSGVVGVAGKRTFDRVTKNYIINHCTVDQLRQLVAFEAPVMKAIAYEGLLRKDKSNSFEQVKMALLDTTSFFYYQSGCIGDILQLGEHLMRNVLWVNILSPSDDEDYVKERFGWTSEQIMDLQLILSTNRQEENRRITTYFKPR